MSNVKYPKIRVRLVGEDGNAAAILGRVKRAMHYGGLSRKVQKEFEKEALKGDYAHLLCTVMDWVTIDDEDEDEDEPAGASVDDKMGGWGMMRWGHRCRR